MKANSYELTQEEKNLLCKTYASDKNILTGNLYDYQVRTIETYREMTNYLQEKYNGKTFEYVSFEVGSGFNMVVGLTFKEANSDRLYEVLVKKNESASEKAEYEDNYYGSMYENAYSEYVSGKLLEKGIKSYVVVRINGLFDKNRCVMLPIEEIKEIYDKAKFNITFYIDSTEFSEKRQNEIVNKIEEEIRKDGQYGTYEVVFVEKMLSKFSDCQECVTERKRNREIGKIIRFNTFDIRGKA